MFWTIKTQRERKSTLLQVIKQYWHGINKAELTKRLTQTIIKIALACLETGCGHLQLTESDYRYLHRGEFSHCYSWVLLTLTLSYSAQEASLYTQEMTWLDSTGQSHTIRKRIITEHRDIYMQIKITSNNVIVIPLPISLWYLYAKSCNNASSVC